MPLVAAVFAPSTPLLVPEIAGRAAAELHDARTACDAAVSELWSAAPELVAVVAAGTRTGEVPPPYRGSFAPWGVPVEVAQDPVDLGVVRVIGDPSTRTTPRSARNGSGLPLGALVGLWLLARNELARNELARNGLAGPVRLWTVDPTTQPADCAALGRTITADRRVALLVLGDGAARHAADPRAEPFDAAVLEALVDVDTARLLELDPALADRLLVTGRAPLQVLAGATGAQRLRSHVRYAAKPYGVGYIVASWS